MKFYQILRQFVKTSPSFPESLEKSLDKVVSRDETNFSIHKRYMNFLRPRKTPLDEPLYKLSSGRSMVEMLGVLAIIGVLSVGAIAGYSKAMTKYKLNKQTEQINTLISAIIRYRHDLEITPQNDTSISLLPYLRMLNEIPTEMLYPSTDSLYDKKIKDVFNNSIGISHSSANYVALGITLQDNNISRQSCQNIYTAAKNFHEHIGYIQTTYYQGPTFTTAGHTWGDSYCKTEKYGVCLKDLKLSDIENLCKICTTETQNCTLMFVWYDNRN